MADSTAPIEAVNPELGRLVNRAKTVLEMISTLEDGSALAHKSAPRGFEEKAQVIMIDITSLEAVLDIRETGSRTRMDEIRLNQQVRNGLADVNRAVEDLVRTMSADAKKRRSGLTAEDIELRRRTIAEITTRRNEVKARLAGRSHDAEAPSALPGAEDISSFMAGGGGGGGGGAGAAASAASAAGGGGIGGGPATEEEEVSAEQEAAMLANRKLDKAVDDELAMMEGLLDDILHANKGLGEALDEGDARLADLSDHMKKTKERVDRVTTNIKSVLEVSDSTSSRCCTYLICLAVLLGIATVIFNVVNNSSQ